MRYIILILSALASLMVYGNELSENFIVCKVYGDSSGTESKVLQTNTYYDGIGRKIIDLLSIGPTYGKSDKIDSMNCNLFYPGRVSLMFRSNGVDSYLYYIGDLRNPMSYEFVYKLNAEETKILSDFLYDMIITKDGKPFTVIGEVPWNTKIPEIEKETIMGAGVQLSDKYSSLRVSGYRWSNLDSINRYYDEYIKYSDNFKNMIRYFDKLAFKAMKQGVLHKGIKFYCNCDSSKVHGYIIDFGEKK